MSFWKPFRKLYIKTTDLTHGFQGELEKIVSFYKLWAFFYDFSVKLDPAFSRELKNMIDSVVKETDVVLDIGCGTKLGNIEVIVGSFPESLNQEAKFDSVISSFTIAHFPVEQRGIIYQHIFSHLISNGRMGLFSAQGEIASTFETKDEIIRNCESAGFRRIEIDEVSDIYRIVKAERP